MLLVLGLLITVIILCLILVIEEWAWKRKLLHDEYQRKFVHIANGIFMAFWPWLLSWHQIQLLAVIGVLATLLYKRAAVLDGLDNIRHNGYGHMTHPLSVLVAAFMTTNKVYFCLAILTMALADGFAAIVGQQFGKHWRYTIFGHAKTVIGTMTFWLISLLVLGIGLLTVRQNFSFEHYIGLIIFAPPILTALENIGILGIDNLLLPPAVILILTHLQA